MVIDEGLADTTNRQSVRLRYLLDRPGPLIQ